MATSNTISAAKLSTNNLMIILLLISLIVVGVASLAVKSLYASIARDTIVVQKTTAADKTLDGDLVAAPTLVSGYQQLGSTNALLQDALPATADFPSLIVGMETMSRLAGMQLKNVAPAPTAAQAGGLPAPTQTADSQSLPVAYPFTLTLNGTYAGLTKLLNALETSVRPMRVTDVQATGTGSALNVQLSVETYFAGDATLPFSKEPVK